MPWTQLLNKFLVCCGGVHGIALMTCKAQTNYHEHHIIWWNSLCVCMVWRFGQQLCYLEDCFASFGQLHCCFVCPAGSLHCDAFSSTRRRTEGINPNLVEIQRVFQSNPNLVEIQRIFQSCGKFSILINSSESVRWHLGLFRLQAITSLHPWTTTSLQFSGFHDAEKRLCSVMTNNNIWTSSGLHETEEMLYSALKNDDTFVSRQAFMKQRRCCAQHWRMSTEVSERECTLQLRPVWTGAWAAFDTRRSRRYQYMLEILTDRGGLEQVHWPKIR